MRPAARVGLAWLLLLGAAAPAGAAARASGGGTLTVGLIGLHPVAADSVEDSPEAFSARALLALPLCRLLPRQVPLLATFSRTHSAPTEEVQLLPVPEARFADGSPLRTSDIAQAWQRLVRDGSPYLALLQPVAGLTEALEAAQRAPTGGLPLPLAFPWPDLEASLCHPAFTPYRSAKGAAPPEGIGLYAPGPEGRWVAARGAPGGPPFPSALSFPALQARAAGRRVLHGEVDAVLGESLEETASPMLYATYLVYAPESVPQGLREALEAVDTEALVRSFVPGQAVPLHALLPPPLMESAPRPQPKPTAPRPTAGGRPFTLGYGLGNAEQRAVAERLQVLLHDAGYAVHLHADAPAALRQGRRAGTLQASLVSVLLPPLPAPALAVVLGLAADGGLMSRELPPLGAEADAVERAARVAERVRALAPQLPVVPLYTRRLRAGLSQALLEARRDAFGLLVLDDAWKRR